MKKSRLSLDNKLHKLNNEIIWSNDRRSLLKDQIQSKISRQSNHCQKEYRYRAFRMALAGVCVCLICFLVLATFLENGFQMKNSKVISEMESEQTVAGIEASYREHISAFNIGDYETYLGTLGKESSITLTDDSLNETAAPKGPIVIEKLKPLFVDHQTVILYSVEDVAVEAEKNYKRYLYVIFHKEESDWIITEKNIFKQYKYDKGNITLQYDLSNDVKQSLSDKYSIDFKVE
ncbi:hypothetical protein [Metabacillus halosaccharovorans]|uniref:hypothetical protein n=1 Tax=Metabacillus halosaccharovorans TaxID=930124 RepID=UPI002040074E|nr:hypothetical protein [Metabacillus halosaccharovorans]MCM3439597.1 hypothetical protein [Metabacillus halosaccharovorans]